LQEINSLVLCDVCDTGTRNLQDDLNDFLAHVPLDAVLPIALDYLANDAEVQEFVIYIQSAEFHKIVLTVEAVPEYKEVSIILYVCLCVCFHSPSLNLTQNIFCSLLTCGSIAGSRLLNSSVTVVLMLRLSQTKSMKSLACLHIPKARTLAGV
jgi:hypothetical protein